MRILVLFDIDGTILQMKNGISKEIFSSYLERIFGRSIENENIPDFHGMTDLQIIKEISASIGFPYDRIENQILDIWNDLSSDFANHCIDSNINIMPGIVELLELLAGDRNISLGLLTGNIKNNAYSKLGAYNLGSFFPIGSFGDDSHDRNELPNIALRRANEFYSEIFTNKTTMIIGDSFRDIECGKTNSIPVIAVSTGGASRESLISYNPEFIFDDFADFRKVYRTITSHFNLDYEKNNSSN